MKLTPLDIQKHSFRPRLRGVDPVEVESFLQLVSEDYEALQRERDHLATRVQELEHRVDDLQRNEKTLQDTLVTAQTLSEDLKKTAMREAEVRVGEAELQAEKVLEASHRVAARIAEDIREMKTIRSRVSAALRQTLESHLALVDTIGAIDETELDDGKVAYLPKPGVRQVGSES